MSEKEKMSEEEAYRLQELEKQEAAALDQQIADDEKLAMELSAKLTQQEVSLSVTLLVVMRNADRHCSTVRQNEEEEHDTIFVSVLGVYCTIFCDNL